MRELQVFRLRASKKEAARLRDLAKADTRSISEYIRARMQKWVEAPFAVESAPVGDPHSGHRMEEQVAVYLPKREKDAIKRVAAKMGVTVSGAMRAVWMAGGA